MKGHGYRMSTLEETRYSLLLRLHDASNDVAWMEFVELYEKALFRYVRSKGLQDADANDVVQQVLIAVHRSVNGWTPQGAGSFRAWLLRVASNLATSVVRQKYHQRMLTGGTTVNKQGQRTLSWFSRKDLHQEADAPTGHSSFHDVAFFSWMLFDQAQCEAS